MSEGFSSSSRGGSSRGGGGGGGRGRGRGRGGRGRGGGGGGGGAAEVVPVCKEPFMDAHCHVCSESAFSFVLFSVVVIVVC